MAWASRPCFLAEEMHARDAHATCSTNPTSRIDVLAFFLCQSLCPLWLFRSEQVSRAVVRKHYQFNVTASPTMIESKSRLVENKNVQANFFLTREIAPPPAATTLAAHFTVRHVSNPGDDARDSLDRFYTAQGFPPGWSHTQLANGAQAVMIDSDESPVAAGWLIRKPFYIEEIRRTFEPAPKVDYYFGDFVAPAFRGQSLQQALIRERLHRSHQTKQQWATAMTSNHIPASLENYRAEGFTVAFTGSKWIVAGVELSRLCCTDRARLHGQLSQEGLRLPFSFYLRSR